MLKLPQSILYAVLALNLTGFTLLLQFDYLVFNALAAKIVSWILTISAWTMVYVKRGKYLTIF